MNSTIPIHGFTQPELARDFLRAGLSAHQALLTFQAIHRHRELDPARMPGISARCRDYLKSLPPLPELTIDEIHRAQDGTIKLRIKTHGGEMVEAVIIPTPRRVTLCVSSQAGCAAACTFCHTGTMGLLRNLEAWEIVAQHRLAENVWRASLAVQSEISNPQSAITNLVFMGMGEPLHNEANVVQACRILGDPLGAGFSRRHIVVSTAGVGNRLRPLWEENVASLAVSLHATTDAVRDRIVPLNRQWNLAALKQTLREIPWRNRETVTVAYLLLAGVNDSQDDARRLAAWCEGLPAKVNLLEFNPYPGSTFARSSPEALAAFRQWLYDYGVFNTHRHSRGADVLAACGQLAAPGKRRNATKPK